MGLTQYCGHPTLMNDLSGTGEVIPSQVQNSQGIKGSGHDFSCHIIRLNRGISFAGSSADTAVTRGVENANSRTVVPFN